MLISVIIPTYNREKLVLRAIESVICQTCKDIEIIIVDDGSSDNTKKYIKQYIDIYGEKIKYFYKENGGVSSARNFGIEQAKGDYISFLDSDDCLLPEKIEKQMKNILKNNADGCYCGHNIVTQMGSAFKYNKICFINGNILENYLRNKTTPNTNSWVINKKVIELYNIRFRDNCSWGEDMEFFSKILFYSKMCYVKENLSNCFVGTNKSLSTFNWDKIDKDIYIWSETWKWLDLNVQEIDAKEKFKSIIFNYRIPALIIYRINKGIRDKEKARLYFNRYNKYLKNIDFCNGLRSFKLWLYYYKIKFTL